MDGLLWMFLSLLQLRRQSKEPTRGERGTVNSKEDEGGPIKSTVYVGPVLLWLA